MRRLAQTLTVAVALALIAGGAWLFGGAGGGRTDGAVSREPPVVTLPQEPDRPVRYVEGDGIVGVRQDGPLLRDASTVRLPPPPGPEPERHRLVVIESATVVNVRSHHLRLAHIEAPDPDAQCDTPAGGTWPCGARARTALRRLVRRRALDCLELGENVSQAPVRPARCTVAGTDLAAWLVEQGWATPSEDAPADLAELHAEAQAAEVGLYAANPR